MASKNTGVTMNPKSREMIEMIGDRQFRIRKMPVWDSSYLLKFVAQKALPVLQKFLALDQEEENENSENETPVDVINAIPELLEQITQEDLRTIIQGCLRFCDISLPAGWQPVMIGTNWGVSDIEYETDTCLLLVWKSIIFNCGAFFGAGGLNLNGMMSSLTKSPTR